MSCTFERTGELKFETSFREDGGTQLGDLMTSAGQIDLSRTALSSMLQPKIS